VSRLAKRFCDRGTVHRLETDVRKKANASIAERGGHFQHLEQHSFLILLFQVNLFFWQIEHASGTGL
jgi:hypothetical protein